MRIEFSRNAIKFGIGCGQKHSSTSGTMASELKIESRRGGSVMSELPISTLKQVVFGDNMDLDTSGDPDDAPNPFEKLREQGAIRAALGKSNPGASISLDWLRVDESDVDEESF